MNDKFLQLDTSLYLELQGTYNYGCNIALKLIHKNELEI